MRMIASVSALLAIVLLFNRPLNLAAEPEWICQKCVDNNGTPGLGWHHFTGVTCIVPETDCFDCRSQGGCHTTNFGGQCDDTPPIGHPWCGNGGNAMAPVDAAIEQQDEVLLASLLDLNRTDVLVVDRMLVFLDCNGSVLRATETPDWVRRVAEVTT